MENTWFTSTVMKPGLAKSADSGCHVVHRNDIESRYLKRVKLIGTALFGSRVQKCNLDHAVVEPQRRRGTQRGLAACDLLTSNLDCCAISLTSLSCPCNLWALRSLYLESGSQRCCAETAALFHLFPRNCPEKLNTDLPLTLLLALLTASVLQPL